MMKVNSKLKIVLIILIILIGIIIVSSISVYATYNYFAKDISYTKADGAVVSIESALNELYENESCIYEEGTFSKYISYDGSYVSVTLNLENYYEEADNARLIITSVNPNSPIYPSHISSTTPIVGNSITFYIFNMSGTASDSQTYTFEYKVINLE